MDKRKAEKKSQKRRKHESHPHEVTLTTKKEMYPPPLPRSLRADRGMEGKRVVVVEANERPAHYIQHYHPILFIYLNRV